MTKDDAFDGLEAEAVATEHDARALGLVGRPAPATGGHAATSFNDASRLMIH
jgi:hypothetical protein